MAKGNKKTWKSKSSRLGDRDKCICSITGGMTNLQLRDSSEVANKCVNCQKYEDGNEEEEAADEEVPLQVSFLDYRSSRLIKQGSNRSDADSAANSPPLTSS